jgi:hypothetical protein
VALLKELEVSAWECGLSLPHFIAEVLQSHAAARRLPKIESPGGVHLPGTPDREENDDFPYPGGDLSTRLKSKRMIAFGQSKGTSVEKG